MPAERPSATRTNRVRPSIHPQPAIILGELAMHFGHDLLRGPLNRRAFLVASGVGFCGLHLPSLVAANQPAAPAGPSMPKRQS